MRAVVVNEFGEPEVFEVREVDAPAVGAGQLLVRVTMSGINFIDVYHRTGLYPMPLPFQAGVEGVGEVVAVGDGVAGITPGQRVGWLSAQGSFSDLVAVSAGKVVPLPDTTDDATAVALLMQGITAHYLATDTYPAHAGEIALVHAAAGGVGLLLTQILTLRGVTVIATASTPEKRALALAAGADHALPYDDFAASVRALTEGRGVDVVYDGVGAATSEGSLASLRPRGMLVFFGNASGPVPPLDVTRLSGLGSLYITRPTVAHYTRTPEELRMRAAELFAWEHAGALHVQPPTQHPLDDIRTAFEHLESRATTGKLVLTH